MIRKITEQDQAVFLAMLDEFYHSPAVMHSIPTEYYQRIFDALMKDSPFVEAYILEKDGQTAGYGQISFSYSTEAGGVVAYLEELYIRPQFQGQGLGQQYFAFVTEQYAGKVARFRLEVERDNEGAIRLYKRLGYDELPYFQMYREFPL